MPEVLPLSLVVAYSVFAGLVHAQREHLNRLTLDPMDGRRSAYYFAVAASVIIGGLTGAYLLYVYFWVAGLLWLAGLFVAAALLGGFVVGGLSVVVGWTALGRVAFPIWPLAAYISYQIVSGLTP
ncbi:MAG: hypothetical protein AB7P40_11135 [Chloroflexota bacterium]